MRINVTDEERNFAGWFDTEKAEKFEEYEENRRVYNDQQSI